MGIDSEQFKEDMKKQAKDLVKQDLALDAWARHFNIEATDEEITAEFEKANVDDPAGKQLEGSLDTVAEDDGALAWIHDTYIKKPKKKKKNQLKKLQRNQPRRLKRKTNQRLVPSKLSDDLAVSEVR